MSIAAAAGPLVGRGRRLVVNEWALVGRFLMGEAADTPRCRDSTGKTAA